MRLPLPTLLFSALGALALGACSNRSCPDIDNPLHTSGAINFRSNIEMRTPRVNGTQWDRSDAIGVYAINAGQKLADGVYNNYANVKYTTPGDGTFGAASTAILYPESGSLDFVAYYPYAENLSTPTLSLNVANQATSDILYSNDAKGKAKGTTDVRMTFRHVLSKLELTITSEKDLTGMTAKLSGLKTTGTLNLADGTTTLGTESNELSLTAKVNGKTATLEAIFLPGQDLKNAKLTIMSGGVTYEWTPTEQMTESNKKYPYDLQLKSDGTVVSLNVTGSTIVDWVAGNTPGDPIVLEPVGEDNNNNGGSTPSPAPEPAPTPAPEPAPEPQPQPNAGSPLFAGGDFEDFDAFTSGLNKYGLNQVGKNAEGEGRTGNALKIEGSIAKNGYLFTHNGTGTSLAGKTKISFYIKGSSPTKSLSFNIYSDAKNFVAYNLADVTTSDVTLQPNQTTFASGVKPGNKYDGSINTNDQWVKVTLDISQIADKINSDSSVAMFAVKLGKTSEYNLLMDDFVVE